MPQTFHKKINCQKKYFVYINNVLLINDFLFRKNNDIFNEQLWQNVFRIYREVT